MNEILIAVILGVVEGITEFLPISSTGHLIVVGHWLQFTGEKANAFEIFIQLGAILAVVGYFRQRIWRLLKLVFRSEPVADADQGLTPAQARRFVVAVGVAFIPAAAVGFLTHEAIEASLFTPKTVALALMIGGAAILLIERFRPQPTTATMEKLSWGQALAVGVAQCASLIPGMSRSASTIMGGLIARLDHAASAEFSFFLSIPTMFAATFYSLSKTWSQLSRDDLTVFAVGLVVSLIVAWLVIAAFMAFIRKHSFEVFGWYRLAFGALLLVAGWRGFR